MPYYVLVFLIVAVIAGVLGFGDIAGSSAGTAKILFYIFLLALIVSVATGVARRKH